MQSLMNSIVQFFNNASSFFYSLYIECYYSAYCPYAMADYFYQLSVLFSNVAWYFSDLFSMMLTKFSEILNWATIKSYILSWLPYIDDVSYWFANWWSNVTSVITSWWNTTQYTVQGWIDTAKAFLQDQINTVNSWLASLQAAWDAFKDKIPTIDEIIAWFANWWSAVLAQIIAWGALTSLQIQDLINTALKDWIPLWESWQDWKDALIEFITDPWQWLYDRAEDLFDRFW